MTVKWLHVDIRRQDEDLICLAMFDDINFDFCFSYVEGLCRVINVFVKLECLM